jgi:hypothetical protein
MQIDFFYLGLALGMLLRIYCFMDFNYDGHKMAGMD